MEQGKKRYIKKGTGVIKGFLEDFILFLKNIWLFFRYDYREIFGFVFICTAVSLIATQFLDWLVNWMITHLTSFAFVSKGNMIAFIKNPVSLLAGLIYLIFATLFSLFEIAGLFHAFSIAQIGRDTNLPGMAAHGWRVVKKTLHPKNWVIIGFLIILMPLTGVLSMSTSGYKAAVPYFIIQGVEANPVTYVPYVIGYVALIVIEIVYIFSINMYVLQDVTFSEAMKNARKLIKGNVMNTIMMMLVLTMLVNFVINSVSSAIPTNIMELLTVFSRSENVTEKSIHVGTYVYVLQKLLKTFFEPMASAAGLTALFYRYVDEKHLLIKMSPDAFRRVSYDGAGLKKYVILTVVFIFVSIGIQVNHYSYLADPVEKPIVCAHRGDNVHAPENTMPAFQLALAEDTPMVECDVIQTADGVVVCSHDYNLKRVTGRNVEISRSTFEEVEQLTMLSSMPGQYEDVRVPKLDELLDLMDKYPEAEIQIELKPTAHDINLEEEVVDMIHAHNIKDRCYVICLNYEPLLKVKELDPEIRTGAAVMAVWDNYVNVAGVDVLSCADSAVSPDLIKTMHENGFKVMVWTVDDIDAVQYLVSCGVDVIGTNDPLQIMEGVELADYAGGMRRIFHVMMHMFKGLESSSLMKGKAS